MPISKVQTSDQLELFKDIIGARIKQTMFVDENTIKDRNYLKKEVLAQLKSLYESIDEADPESITCDAADLATYAFYIGRTFGKMNVYGQKIINSDIDDLKE